MSESENKAEEIAEELMKLDGEEEEQGDFDGVGEELEEEVEEEALGEDILMTSHSLQDPVSIEEPEVNEELEEEEEEEVEESVSGFKTPSQPPSQPHSQPVSQPRSQPPPRTATSQPQPQLQPQVTPQSQQKQPSRESKASLGKQNRPEGTAASNVSGKKSAPGGTLPATASGGNALSTDANLTIFEDQDDNFFESGWFSIEASPAFQYIEQLKIKKEIPVERAEQLHIQLSQLHDFLLQTFEYEKLLLRKAKALSQDVSKQRVDMDQVASKAYSNNSEIGDLKRELLKIQNESSLCETREEKITKDIADAEHQRNELAADIDEIRRHKADLLEPQLIASTKELKLDVLQRRHQVENLRKDLEEKKATYAAVFKEKENLEEEKERNFTALAAAVELPIKIAKNCEVLREAIDSLILENEKKSALSTQLDKEIDRMNKRRKDLEDEKHVFSTEIEKRRTVIHEREKMCDQIYKEHELAKEQLAIQKAERLRLDMNIKKLNHEIKREHDMLLRSIREKESTLKQHRRLEATVNNIKATFPSLEEYSEDLKRRVEATRREARYYKVQTKDLRKQIDLAIFEFLEQQNHEGKEKELLAQQRVTNIALETDLDAKLQEANDWSKQMESYNLERELKSRDFIRIQSKYRKIKDDARIKHLQVAEAGKRCSEALNHLKEFAALYEVVKNERNKYVNLIQATVQRAAEMKEKIKILSNELEILRHEIMLKDREFLKKKQENTAAYALRDNGRNEANKLLAVYRDRRDQIERHLNVIENLNHVINTAEEEMSHIKSKYEVLLRQRNHAGMRLLDRNDELCILHEKANMQQAVLQKGEDQQVELREDLARYELVNKEFRRKVELEKKKKPQVAHIEEELIALQTKLNRLQKRTSELSCVMESPEDRDRCHNLAGKDPTQAELLQKLKILEERLAEREERMLEKDLIYEEVTLLTDRLESQYLNSKDGSIDYINKLNDMSRKIKYLTRKMMGRVSELSMYQALALSLKQEKLEKETILQEYTSRLEHGESPSEELEKEFQMKEYRKILRHRQSTVAADSAEAWHEVNGYMTSAEPRPNAYIPDVDLPVPKPYGRFQPFKPTVPGSTMRHIRKPTTRPIEL